MFKTFILNRCLGTWCSKYLEEVSLTILHCCILLSLNYVNTAQFSVAYIKLQSCFPLMTFLFGMWLDLIFYKLFIRCYIPPTSAVCIMEIQTYLYFKQEQGMLFCFLCTCRVEILSVVDYTQNQFMKDRDCHRIKCK